MIIKSLNNINVRKFEILFKEHYTELCLFALKYTKNEEEAEVYTIVNKIRLDIEQIADTSEIPTRLSIGMATGKIYNIKPLLYHSKKEFRKDPTVFLAYKALKEAKKRGGNQIVAY